MVYQGLREHTKKERGNTMKKYFDTFAERKHYEVTTSREILDYGIEFVCGVKKYYLILK